MTASNLKTWIFGMALCLSLAVAGACSKAKKDESNKTPTTEQTPADTPKPVNLDKGPDIADQDLPVETDFEEEATSQITADNYLKELEALEKEIGQ